MATQTGFTEDTAKRLMLDAGAFYKNYNVSTGVGTLLGATRGGGQFTAVPTVRPIEIDGVKGRAKGLTVLDSWEVAISANFIEVTPGLLAAALATGDIATSDATFDVVTARKRILPSDYIDNIAYVGTISGSSNPVVIVLQNALADGGITLTTADKAEAVLPVKFIAHFDASNLNTVPFAIYYPKLSSDTTPPTVSTVPADSATSVAVSANFVWTFSEAIQPPAVNGSNFMVVKASDGTAVAGVLSLSSDKLIVTFDPTSNLTAATAYVAIATTNVKDLFGNALAANNITNFTTA